MQQQEETTDDLYDYLDDENEEQKESELIADPTPKFEQEGLSDGGDDDYDSNSDDSSEKFSDYNMDLDPAQKIDLWQKLKDLMLNQLREERQVSRARES